MDTGSKLAVVIPVAKKAYGDKLMESIAANTVRPEQIIVIDVFETGELSWNGSLPIEIHNERLLPNLAYIFGASKVRPEMEFISMLNDDIILNPFFFEKVIKMMATSETVGVVCPNTTRHMDRFLKEKHSPEIGKRELMPRREGWAYTIRKKVYDAIPPLPGELKVFFMDDWIFLHCSQMHKSWIWDRSNLIHHVFGGSMQNTNLLRQISIERVIFEKITGIDTKAANSRRHK